MALLDFMIMQKCIVKGAVMSTNLSNIAAFRAELMSLEECLTELEKYGRPRLSKVSTGGWHACIDVFVTGKGVEFEVKSEFNCKNPVESANQCYQRLVKAIKQIKETE